ncbi:hypothetical protein HCN51_23600 [Nonomuraea sp. FMUSA5-5]|uniref:Peptidase inhibitor family I36 n=1 Tax=Nonomuraea composti TaxID=2720023 RepID=A0ABX1BB95_9ACTN|nr:hypothetical protein [Nonomuraea sp. FMUSA5-5]
MRKLLMIMAVAVLAMTGLSGPATAQTATAAAWECPGGYVCFYGSQNGVDKICQTAVSGAFTCNGVRSLFNNGFAAPGLDHVDLYGPSGGYFGCFHYGWAEGRYNVATGFAINIARVQWRGECPAAATEADSRLTQVS